jgi:hypothetical protein
LPNYSASDLGSDEEVFDPPLHAEFFIPNPKAFMRILAPSPSSSSSLCARVGVGNSEPRPSEIEIESRSPPPDFPFHEDFDSTDEEEAGRLIHLPVITYHKLQTPN